MRTTVPAVIVRCVRQRDLVDRLVQYCKELDGTDIVVLDADESVVLPYPQRNDAAFHQAAEHFKGQAFFWMEPDSVPLRAGWLQTCTDAYKKSKKEFMLAIDSKPPLDCVGGIGIYGPNSHWFIPKKFEQCAWDMWMFQHAQEVTLWSPLIQHSYGRYVKGGAIPYRFPKDERILRPEAVIFHRDSFQDLIVPDTGVDPKRRAIEFKHGGDLGDVIAALPILRQMGGGKIVLFHDPNARVGLRGRESLEGARFNALKPLLEAQNYVTEVVWGEGIDTGNFRETPRPKHENLLERQARHAGVWPVATDPWLTVPKVEQHKRVICARSPRYHCPAPFPWKELSDAYGDRLLFVGMPDEHAAFEQVVGRRVEHAKTETLLDVANIMAGAPMVVANQSAPAWIALGLGVKLVLEGNPEFPNTEIRRPGNFFAYTPQDMATLRKAFAAVKK